MELSKKKIIVSLIAFTMVFTSIFGANTLNTYAATDKKPGEIIEGEKHYGENWEKEVRENNVDVMTYIEMERLPYRVNVLSTGGKNAVYSIIVNSKVHEYKLEKNDDLYDVVDTVNYYQEILIKKPGKLKLTVTKPADKEHEEVTKEMVITFVDKRYPTKIKGVKSKYTKTYGDKSFTLEPDCWYYWTEREMWMNEELRREQCDKYGWTFSWADYPTYRLPSFKSSDENVAKVTSDGKVYVKKPGKAIITMKTRPRYMYADETLSESFAKPTTRNITVVVKPTKGVIKSTKVVNKNQLKLTWAKKTGATGYSIRYSRNANFTNATKVTVKGQGTLSYTTKNLTKGKNYYVKTRAYTKCKDGSIIYGKWSDVKKVRI